MPFRPRMNFPMCFVVTEVTGELRIPARGEKVTVDQRPRGLRIQLGEDHTVYGRIDRASGMVTGEYVDGSVFEISREPGDSMRLSCVVRAAPVHEGDLPTTGSWSADEDGGGRGDRDGDGPPTQRA